MPRRIVVSLLVGAVLCAASAVVTACGAEHHTTQANASSVPSPDFGQELNSRLGVGQALDPKLVVFKRRYTRVIATAVPIARRITRTLQAARATHTASWLVKRFGTLSTDMGHVNHRLERLKPPHAVAGVFRRYIASLDRVQQDLAAVAKNASAVDVPKIRSAARALVRDIARTGRPNAALNHKLGLSSS